MPRKLNMQEYNPPDKTFVKGIEALEVLFFFKDKTVL